VILPELDLPEPPPDEPWRIWHRAASEQVVAAISSPTEDPQEVLARARDFAARALAQAAPLERLFTESLIAGIDEVERVLKAHG
jgi:hypothetical protein